MTSLPSCPTCGEPVAMPAFCYWDVPKSDENPVGRACGRCQHPAHPAAQRVVEAACARIDRWKFQEAREMSAKGMSLDELTDPNGEDAQIHRELVASVSALRATLETPKETT